MKVILDCSHLSIGGGIQVGLAILNQAARTTAVEWHVVLSEQMNRQVSREMKDCFRTVTSLPTFSKLDRWNLRWRVPEIEKSIRPDVVYTIFGPSLGVFHAPNLQGFAVPELVYPEIVVPRSKEEQILVKLRTNIYRAAFRKADYLVVETGIVRERLEKHLNFSKERVFIVRNSYSPQFQDIASRLTAKMPHENFNIIIPSSYYSHKNLEIIPSVANLLNDMIKVDFKFVFTLPDSGLGWRRISRIAKDISVLNRIKTVGELPHADIPYLYFQADAVFLPTLLECSTAVYPESFMAGVPLATCDIDFARNLCGDAAVYFDPYRPQSAASALATLISDGKLREMLVKRGKQVLSENYPTPEEKWQEQMRCIHRAVELGKPHRGYFHTK